MSYCVCVFSLRHAYCLLFAVLFYWSDHRRYRATRLTAYGPVLLVSLHAVLLYSSDCMRFLLHLSHQTIYCATTIFTDYRNETRHVHTCNKNIKITIIKDTSNSVSNLLLYNVSMQYSAERKEHVTMIKGTIIQSI